jgi:glycosyltransferase involved in cell wall biosynthesis
MKRRDSNPWLSVILPTLNGAAFVGDALESIAQQDTLLLRKVEVIAIDDGSSDAILSILHSYRKRLPLHA